MNINLKLAEYKNLLNAQYKKAKRNANSDTQTARVALRIALECVVSIVWLKKQGVDVLHPENKSKKLSLWDAIKDERFVAHFDEMLINDLHVIRIFCNQVVHATPFDVNVESDIRATNTLLQRFKDRVNEIESILGIKLLVEDIPLEPTPSETVQNHKDKPVTKPSTPIAKKSSYAQERATTGSAEAAALTFFEILEKEITNNNSGFTIDSTTKTSAGVNKATSKVWLALDFLVKNGIFRVAIYIPNDSKTRYYDRLIAKKDEIESALGFNPEWLDKGAKSDNTRWIKTEMSFIPHSDSDYKRLAKEALPIIAKYVKVFSLYLPEAFR